MKYNTALDATPFSVFEDLERRVSINKDTPLIRLHQGKTTFPPATTLNGWTEGSFELEAHGHASPAGILTLRKSIAEHETNKRNRVVHEDDVMITSGASHALHLSLHALVSAGDEVMILSPQWLFANGLVRASGALPVEVPVFMELSKDSDFDFVAAMSSYVTEKTRAIYFNTPNNPTGYSMNQAQLAKLVAFAKENDLWILSDNAYEHYDFTDHGFIDISQLDGAQDRTFSIHSFSKSYIMPGYRAGYIIPPAGMADRLRKFGLYSIYSVATPSQYGAYQALQQAPSALTTRYNAAKRARDITLETLTVPNTGAMGGFYSFLDLTAWQGGDVDSFVNRCIAEGVTVAPGIAFGEHCQHHARVCFTAVGEDELRVGLNIINSIYGSPSPSSNL